MPTFHASTRTQALPCPVQVYAWVMQAHVAVGEFLEEGGGRRGIYGSATPLFC